jgi:hypothetical protein
MLYDVFPETTIKITKPENAVHLMDDVEAILRDHRDPEEAFE